MREVIETAVMYASGVGAVVAVALAVRGLLQMRAWDREQGRH
jgi:hypothetical protein